MSTKTKQARLEKQKKAVYNMTAEQLDQIEARIKKECLYEAFITMLALPVMFLNDHYKDLIKVEDCGKKRPERFTDGVLKLWEEFNEGTITIDDCIKVLKDECGIDLLKGVKK